MDSNHRALVLATCKPGHDILGELSAFQAHLLHMAVGVAGEAGELLDAVKKNTIYQKPLDRENVVEELGDLMYYMHGIMIALDLDPDEVLQKNINKLTKRYKNGYSNQAAQERADKAGE